VVAVSAQALTPTLSQKGEGVIDQELQFHAKAQGRKVPQRQIRTHTLTLQTRPECLAGVTSATGFKIQIPTERSPAVVAGGAGLVTHGKVFQRPR
jgi:hypothetical protein